MTQAKPHSLNYRGRSDLSSRSFSICLTTGIPAPTLKKALRRYQILSIVPYCPDVSIFILYLPLVKMSTGKRVSTTATNRLKQDYIRIRKDPVPYVTAAPLPSNILEWHYVVRGPEKTPYEGGLYHGKLVFPQEFPFKPPSIYMITPNGRFKCNTRLCLSISDFHPDTWNPAWSVSTILTGLLSFMVELNPTLGSIETSDYTKRQLAVNSWEFNLKNQTFTELFPEIGEEARKKVNKRLEELRASTESGGAVGDVSRSLVQTGAVNFGDRQQGIVGGTLTNVLVIVGFAAFAWTVKYVLRTISQPE
ncbi:ubiquitin-conjugating enzyme E2 J2-like isoform X1 [Apostichopus japonicus]|uniref:ubiquitin-conjugating enzyme E2 J2-like isoform X1 n=2 Tax=Stichopus japonicus TaxID=307972 RepID=UPI003AB91601